MKPNHVVGKGAGGLYRSFVGMIAVFLLLWISPNAVLAHTGLSSSYPENNETVQEALQEMTLTFNTDIEPASKFEVVDEAGTAYTVANIKVNRSQMTGTMEAPLPNGVYTVNWRIIGQDGHSVKGAFSFKVEIPSSEPPNPSGVESEAPAPPSPSPSPTDSAAPGASTPVASSQAPPSQTETVPSEGPSLSVSTAASWIFLGLSAVVLASFIVIAIVRRKPR